MRLVVVVVIASLSDGTGRGLAAEERDRTEEACSGGGFAQMINQSA